MPYAHGRPFSGRAYAHPWGLPRRLRLQEGIIPACLRDLSH
jgi:hypothetical protein